MRGVLLTLIFVSESLRSREALRAVGDSEVGEGEGGLLVLLVIVVVMDGGMLARRWKSCDCTLDPLPLCVGE